MKFLVDAHLPRALVTLLRQKGFDVIHTTELPLGNDTADIEINKISITEERIVITKDGDFYESFTNRLGPYKLPFVRTGNISNRELTTIFEKNLDKIVEELSAGSMVEVNRSYIIMIH